MLQLTDAELIRFRSKVVIADGCWSWTGEVNSAGYPRLAVYRNGGRQRLLAHRISYFIATGEDPAFGVVMHACDNPKCTRPEHLSLGTQADNLRDAAKKGRVALRGLALSRDRREVRLAEKIAAQAKTCWDCRRLLPFADFHRMSSSRDGRQRRCKACKQAARHA